MNYLLTALAAKPATVFIWILGIAVALLAGLISVLVAKQNTNEEGLSGTLGGGNTDSFFGKSKTMTRDRFLSRLTLISTIVFVVMVLALVILVSATLA